MGTVNAESDFIAFRRGLIQLHSLSESCAASLQIKYQARHPSSPRSAATKQPPTIDSTAESFILCRTTKAITACSRAMQSSPCSPRVPTSPIPARASHTQTDLAHVQASAHESTAHVCVQMHVHTYPCICVRAHTNVQRRTRAHIAMPWNRRLGPCRRRCVVLALPASICTSRLTPAFASARQT